MGGQDASWWPGAHTSAPKAPSTYAAESRSKANQGLGWVGENKQVIAVQVIQVDSEDKWKRESLWPWETRLAKLPLLTCHSATPLLCHSATLPLCHSATLPLRRPSTVPTLMRETGHTSPQSSWNIRLAFSTCSQVKQCDTWGVSRKLGE